MIWRSSYHNFSWTHLFLPKITHVLSFPLWGSSACTFCKSKTYVWNPTVGKWLGNVFSAAKCCCLGIFKQPLFPANPNDSLTKKLFFRTWSGHLDFGPSLHTWFQCQAPLVAHLPASWTFAGIPFIAFLSDYQRYPCYFKKRLFVNYITVLPPLIFFLQLISFSFIFRMFNILDAEGN